MTTLTKINNATETTSQAQAVSREPAREDVAKTNFVAQKVLRNEIGVIGTLRAPRSAVTHSGLVLGAINVRAIVGNGSAFAGGQEYISYDLSSEFFQSLMGLALGTLVASGSIKAKGALEDYEYAKKIGDTDGQLLALASVGLFIPQAGGGGSALLKNSLQIYDMAQQLLNVDYRPVAEVSQSINVFSTAVPVFFGIFYSVVAFVSAFSLYQKSQIKKELPDGDIRAWLDGKMDVSTEVGKHSEDEFIALALEEGEKWLTDIEKDWKAQKLEPLRLNSEKRKGLIRKLFEQNDDMAKFTGIAKLKGTDLMIAFGKKIMTERLQARQENKLSRIIDQAIIDKYKTTNEPIAKADVIKQINKGMIQSGGIIFLGIVGVVLCVCALIFTGGIPALFVALGFAISAALWLLGPDGTAFMKQWKGEQTGKFDKGMLIFSTLLNIVAVVGTIVGMIVITGGIALVPLILLILVGLFWAVVNARGIYTYARHSSRPWEYEKVVTLGSLHKLTRKETRYEEIEKYFQKMSQADQALFQGRKDWKEVTPMIINELAELRNDQLIHLNRYARSLSS